MELWERKEGCRRLRYLYLFLPEIEPVEERNRDGLWRACRRGLGKHWTFGRMNDLLPIKLY